MTHNFQDGMLKLNDLLSTVHIGMVIHLKKGVFCTTTLYILIYNMILHKLVSEMVILNHYSD